VLVSDAVLEVWGEDTHASAVSDYIVICI
jgi:hypothetical protein